MDTMDEVRISLAKIARGTIFFSVGTLLALFFSFLQRWAIIRVTTPEEYGLYSLSLAVVAIFVSVGTLGLNDGIARTISYSSRSSGISKKGIFSSLIFLSLTSGGICFFLLTVFSPHISSFFRKDFMWILTIVSISVPFSLLLEFLISFFRGIERAEVKVVFNDVFKNVIFFSILIFVLLRKMSFPTVVTGYTTSIVISAVLIFFYTFKKIGIPQMRGMTSITKEMLLFSLPLMAGSLFQLIITWADTLLLGVFRSSAEIGLYNAALPTSKLIQTVTGAVIFIFMPVTASLFSRGLMSEIKRVYTVISKWMLSVTLPLFFVLFLHAELLFFFLYGSDYSPAVLPFRIIAIGYLLNTSFGPNRGALIAMGKTKTMMVIISITAATNLFCNVGFIPQMGITGAALSMLITLAISSAARGIILYRISGIHPITQNYVKPVFIYLLFVWVLQTFLDRWIQMEAWMLPFLLIIHVFVYGFSMILTKSIDQEDIWMLLILEKRMGLNLEFLKKIIKKLLR